MGPVVAVAGEELDLVVVDARHDPVAVELDLITPLATRGLFHQRRQFRFDLVRQLGLVCAGQWCGFFLARLFMLWRSGLLDGLGFGRLGCFGNEGPFAEHAVGLGGHHVVIALRPGGTVLMLDQEPLLLLARHVRAHQVP
ncbi:hypothetical protein D3C75_781060 [compost metagenome]